MIEVKRLTLALEIIVIRSREGGEQSLAKTDSARRIHHRLYNKAGNREGYGVLLLGTLLVPPQPLLRHLYKYQKPMRYERIF